MSLLLFSSFPIKSRSLSSNSVRFTFRFLLSRPLRSNFSYSFPRSFTPMASIHSSVDNEVALATRLWNNFRRESFFALYTPFMVSLASGNLLIESFRYYIAQDVHFLKAFVKAYELAEECADDDEVKLLILALRKAALKELKMHKSFVQEWGLDVEKECAINPGTVKYTDFLLATASGKVEGVKGLVKFATPFERTKVAAYTLGAMTPCVKLYAHLGKQFHAFLDSENYSHPYKKWICKYASEGFQASALQTEDLLDKLSVSLTGEELRVIEKLYYQALKLEIDFFYAQPLAQSTVVPLTREQNPTEEHLMIFSDFDLTCTVVDSSAILAEIAIVTAPKPDQNLSENQIDRMSSADLRNMWEVLSGRYTEEYEQSIESIMPTEKGELSKLNVHANELTYENSISTGEIVTKVQSPIDKVEAFNDILKNSGDEKRNLTVYIGDSVGDLLCLLEADIGIVIGSSTSLRRIGTQFGVSFVPLFSGLTKKQRGFDGGSFSSWKGRSGVLYTVSSWAEIHAFILGY